MATANPVFRQAHQTSETMTRITAGGANPQQKFASLATTPESSGPIAAASGRLTDQSATAFERYFSPEWTGR